MSWYWRKWWRFALSPSRGGIFYDVDGRWVHVCGPVWFRTGPEHSWCSECEGEGKHENWCSGIRAS